LSGKPIFGSLLPFSDAPGPPVKDWLYRLHEFRHHCQTYFLAVTASSARYLHSPRFPSPHREVFEALSSPFPLTLPSSFLQVLSSPSLQSPSLPFLPSAAFILPLPPSRPPLSFVPSSPVPPLSSSTLFPCSHSAVFASFTLHQFAVARVS